MFSVGQADATSTELVVQVGAFLKLLMKTTLSPYTAEQARLATLPATTRAPYRYILFLRTLSQGYRCL